MDPSNPLATITPTLDAAVLRTLTATTGWTTGGEIHRRTGSGSSDGVRKVLRRLARQGIVLADPHPHATLYLFNRGHVCAPAIVTMVRAREQIVDRLSGELAGWEPQPSHASIFGSFARGEAGEESDIDLLLVRPQAADSDHEHWNEQIDQLSASVQMWTGNAAHVVDVQMDILRAMVADDDPLVSSWRADHVDLMGARLLDVLRQAS